MKKKLSLFLAVVMLVSMVPTYAMAASTPTITLESVEANAGEEVTLTLSVANNPGIYMAYLDFTYDESALTLVSCTEKTGVATAELKTNDGYVVQWDMNSKVNYETDGVLYEVTFAVGDSATGDYIIEIGCADDDEENLINVDYDAVSFDFVNATISVGSSGEDSTSGYTVDVVNSSSDLVAVNGAVALNVNVNNTFNSAKITMSYDTNYLTFVNGTVASGQTMGEKDQAVSITGSNGVITIVDYGTAFASGTAYTLNFTAAAATTGSEVKVTYAGLSTAEEAKDSDLTAATTLGTVSVPVGYTVTVPTATDNYTFTASASTVVPGGSVDITVNNPYYDYELSATGGTLINTTNGWTVSSVTGNVDVSVTSATPKAFDVTVEIVDSEGNKITEDENNKTTTDGATYNTQFNYTLPDDTAASTTAGVQYTLSSITVGGNSATYTSSGRTYTIQGANVTGDIVVTVTKQDLDPNAFTVSVEGETSAGTLEVTQVDKNGTAKLTLKNKEAGYTYTVTATMGGSPVTPTQSDDVYTVSGVTGNVVFTISKTLDTTSLNVSQYVQLDGTVMWLVKINGNGTEQISGKTYTYDGNNMFWSSKYQAYCYLIVEATDPYNNADESAKAAFTAKFGMADTTAVSISYNGNVNLTKDANSAAVIDVNDAQLVWNMYSAVYSDFTDNVTVQKFLEADMDATVGLSTNDAAEVVKLIG